MGELMVYESKLLDIVDEHAGNATYQIKAIEAYTKIGTEPSRYAEFQLSAIDL